MDLEINFLCPKIPKSPRAEHITFTLEPRLVANASALADLREPSLEYELAPWELVLSG
jgi:hypothetical protein